MYFKLGCSGAKAVAIIHHKSVAMQPLDLAALVLVLLKYTCDQSPNTALLSLQRRTMYKIWTVYAMRHKVVLSSNMIFAKVCMIW